MLTMNKARFINILLKRHAFTQLKEEDWDKLLRILRQTDLLSSFAYTTNTYQSEVPEYFRRHLVAAKVFSDAQTRQVFNACALIQKAADDLKIDILFLKGAAYSIGHTTNSFGRLFSDIDILVKPSELSRLEEYLNANGWTSKDLNDYDDKYYREWSHELPPFTHLASGVSLDIHHTLLPPISGYKVDLEDLWSNRVTLSSGLAIPSHPYLILHSAIHLLLNEDVKKGFRDLLDIYLLFEDTLKNSTFEQIREVFCRSGFEFEFDLLIALLNQSFHCQYTPESEVLSRKLAFWKRAYYKSIFPALPELEEKSYAFSRSLVYVNGHLNKMPLGLFIKHISYKASRAIAKKAFGDFIFK